MIENKRICTGCKNEFPATLEFFNKAKRGKFGLTANCKSCNNQYKRDNWDKVSLSNKLWNLENKEKKRTYNKNYRKENKEILSLQGQEKYRKNKDYMMERSREYMNKRRKSDPNFRLLCNLRTRLYHAVKENVKSARTMELLGCTIPELRKHLENQFDEGMTWDNYGKWHIDHIIPCSAFDLSEKEQQFKCFNHTNLQPLWAEDNLKKNNKIPNTGGGIYSD